MTTLPNFKAATFKSGDPIDNSYFPLKPGTIYTYEGEKKMKRRVKSIAKPTDSLSHFKPKTLLVLPPQK
jgi:hypothetical protein